MIIILLFLTLELVLKFIKNYLIIIGSYIYHGFCPLLELLGSLSALFGLVRFIEGLVTEDLKVFSYGLAFLISGLFLTLMVRSIIFLSRRGIHRVQ